MVSAHNIAGSGPVSERVMAKPEKDEIPIDDIEETNQWYQVRCVLFFVIIILVIIALFFIIALKLKSGKKRKLSELKGLGKEIWQNINADKYVTKLRDEWNDRDNSH